MKQVIAGAMTLVLTLLTFGFISFASVAPASAGSDKVNICHATSAANGHYNFISVSKDATANGHSGGDHQGGRDIIPSYTYYEKVDGVNTKFTFPGQNTTKTESQFTEADCPTPVREVETIVASPNAPTYVPPTCANPEFPYGRLTIPANLGTGVASASEPVFGHNNATLSTTYTLLADTDKVVYKWADTDGETKTFTFNTTHISSDPLWVVDGATGVGACELSNTGLFGFSDEATYIGGGLLALGALFIIGNAVTKRRAA